MNKYNQSNLFSNLKGDIYGGFTAAVIALPLALAFGVISGLGASAGLYGAIILGFFAALLGGTSTQISGPTGPMTVVIAGAVTTFSGNIEAVMATIFLAGILQIAMGYMKLGTYIKHIPYPVISGFMSGIGAIIILLQLNPLLGNQPISSTIEVLLNIPNLNIDYPTVFLGVLTIFIVFFTPKRVSKIIPSPLIALLLVTSLSIVLEFDVARIGSIPQGLPEFKIFSLDLHLISQIIATALTLAVLASIDSLLTSIVADSLTKTKHNSNKELIGQGIGNTICSFFGAIPGAGATMRTVVNIKTGGLTKLSGIIHALSLLVITLFLAPLASQIPMAVLSGILVKVGFDILDYRFLKLIKKAPKHDTIVMVLVFLLTLFVDLIVAVGAGITMASLLITYRVAQQSNVNIAKEEMEQLLPHYENEDKIKIVQIQGAFFFGSVSQIIDGIDHKISDTKYVIIDVQKVQFFDLSALFALEDMIDKVNSAHLNVMIVTTKEKIECFKGLDLYEQVGIENIFFDLQDAIKNANNHFKAKEI